MDAIKSKKPLYISLDRFTLVMTRESLNEAAVQEYSQALKDGVELDPVRAFHPPGSQTLFLACGCHRLEAHRRAGRNEIATTIESGDRWEAFQAGVADNLKHGAKLTLADRKKNAREFLKREPEWSTELVAKRVGLSSPTVESIRREMTSTSQILESGKRLGADGRVRSLPKRPESTASASVSSAETSTGPVSDHPTDTLSVPDSPSEPCDHAENSDACSNEKPTKKQVLINHLFVPTIYELIVSNEIAGSEANFMRLSEYSEYEQREILGDVIAGRCTTLADALLGDDCDEVDEDELDANLDSEPPEEISESKPDSVAQDTGYHARTNLPEPSPSHPSNAESDGEGCIAPATPHDASERIDRPLSESKSASKHEAAQELTRGDTEQSHISERNDTVSPGKPCESNRVKLANAIAKLDTYDEQLDSLRNVSSSAGGAATWGTLRSHARESRAILEAWDREYMPKAG